MRHSTGDRYADELGGTKVRASSMEECVDLVRVVYSTAWKEGSTGAERTFWTANDDSDMILAGLGRRRLHSSHVADQEEDVYRLLADDQA